MKEQGRITPMNRGLLVLICALSFLGIADSWYLYQSAVTDTALSCDIGAGLDGCNIVAQSAYSKLLGIPVALYGVGFFALMFALAALLLVRPTRGLQKALMALSVVGVVASAVFVFIQVALIKALCVYCILSAVIVAGIAYAAWKVQKPAFIEPEA